MRVVLIGGPLDGQEREIADWYLRKTFSWQTDEVHAVRFGDDWRQATPIAVADYKLFPDGTWRWVGTQRTIGDTELEEDQLRLEDA